MWTDGVSTKLSILVECDSIPTDKHEIPTPATTAAKSTVERTGWTVCERMCVGGQGGPVQVQTHSTAIHGSFDEGIYCDEGENDFTLQRKSKLPAREVVSNLKARTFTLDTSVTR